MNGIMNLKYFEKPTQVMFVNPDAPEGKCWSVGIAYKDEVIWCLNSWVFTISEVYMAAQKRNCQNYITKINDNSKNLFLYGKNILNN